jgi:hypothetical protein
MHDAFGLMCGGRDYISMQNQVQREQAGRHDTGTSHIALERHGTTVNV